VSPNDFYAGAMATAAIILFAKFLSHRPREERERQCRSWWTLWKVAHVLCVVTTFVALVFSLAVLGGLPPRKLLNAHQAVIRDIVFGVVVAAAAILASDIAFPRRD
jgi:multisubunit Na+/H+ antiporter MnhB subunit